MYAVTEEELDGFVRGDASISLGLLGLSFGGAVACAITLLTVNLAEKPFAGFVAATIAASLWFGVRALMDYQQARRKAERIKTTDRLLS